MNIGIIHLTDIHISETTNLSNKVGLLCQAVKNHLLNVTRLYIVVSGDIANTGAKKEYDLASHFLKLIKQLLLSGRSDLDIKIILTPGNHDCDFSSNTQLRNNSINSLSYSSLGKDNSVSNLCLEVQNNFWDFYSNFNPVPNEKLYYTIEDRIGNEIIAFNCINTAWCSQKNEVVGSLFYPVKKISSSSQVRGKVRVCVYHHPLNWFTPNTDENNRMELQAFIEKQSDIQLFGHEHHQEARRSEDMLNQRVNTSLSGKIFNNNQKPNESGFYFISIDLKTQTGIVNHFDLKDGKFYDEVFVNNITINNTNTDSFLVKEVFLREMNEMKIPINIGDRKDLRLSDIYVYPDIEIIDTKEDNNIDDYSDSIKLVKDSKFSYSILDGESQVGKTSLIAMLYREFYNGGIYPLLLRGDSFKDADIEKILRRAYEIQYKSELYSYTQYSQLPNTQKVLLIDDFHECGFNSTTIQSILDKASSLFSKVIITIDPSYSILPTIQSEYGKFNFFRIKPLGHKKRNELIENYHSLKEDALTIEEHELMETVKQSYDDVQKIMGNKYMPPLPIYILSILQSLDYKTLQLNETSFGYCYQTLIHYALHSAGIKNEDIDSFINFLTELAYLYVEDTKTELKLAEFEKFFQDYRDRFIFPSYDKAISLLKKSKIIVINNGEVKFTYRYILYYLSAKKISEILHTKEGEKCIQKLFNELHLEKNANILVFVTHHSKDISFIEQSLLKTMIVLEGYQAITLNKNDPFYEVIKDIAESLKSDILEANVNPKDSRKEMLERSDESERSNEKSEKDEEDEENNKENEMREMLKPFKHSYGAIEILGQIIKNRKGSLEKKQLKNMTKELYTTGFRTVFYWSEIIDKAKNSLDKAIRNSIAEDDSRREMEEKITRFLQMIRFQACIGVFSQLTNAVGHKDLKLIYNEVAEEINTPAAKLISFGINSYYGTISMSELKDLAVEFKDNVVAFELLRGRVKHYVYNKKLDYKTKSQIASYMKFKIGPVNPKLA